MYNVYGYIYDIYMCVCVHEIEEMEGKVEK